MSDNQKNNSRKKTTLWSFLFLNIKFVISVVNGILIIPLYLYYIDSPVYGAWLATGNVLTWITMVDPGVSDVLLQRVSFALGKNDKNEVGVAITSGIFISIVLFILSMGIGYALSFFISDIANIDHQYRSEIETSFRIAIWGTVLSLVSNTFSNIILAFQKTKLHGIYVNGIMFFSIIVNVVLLVMHFGVYALAYTSLFRGLSTFGAAVILALFLIHQNKIKLRFQFDYFKTFSKVFVYTFSSRLFDTFASNIDLIIVSRYLGSQAVTVLDLSRRPLRIVSGLANNVTISMLPALPHLFGSGETEKIKSTIMRIWMIILWMSGFIIGGFILFNFSLVNNWVGAQFWIGNTNNVIMCLSFLLLSIGYNLSNITYSMGDIKNNSLINLVRSIAYLFFLFILAKTIGMPGVLLAFLLPLFIMVWYYPRKVCKEARLSTIEMKILIKESLLIGAVILAVIIASYCFVIQLSWLWLIIGSGIYAAGFLGLLVCCSDPFRKEINAVIGKLKFQLQLKQG